MAGPVERKFIVVEKVASPDGVIDIYSMDQYDYDEEIALKYELFSRERLYELSVTRDPVTGDPMSVFADVGRYFMDTDLSVESSAGWWTKHPDDVRVAIANYLFAQRFEPNDASLWVKAGLTIESYLSTLWKRGLIRTPGNVQVGLGKTMTSEDIQNDKLIVEYECEFTDPLRDGLKSRKYYEDVSRITLDMGSSGDIDMYSETLAGFGKPEFFDLPGYELWIP